MSPNGSQTTYRIVMARTIRQTSELVVTAEDMNAAARIAEEYADSGIAWKIDKVIGQPFADKVTPLEKVEYR